MMVKVDARGDACPLPVVKAKKALSELNGTGEVEVPAGARRPASPAVT